MRPSQAFHVLEILRNSSSVPLYRKGVELSFNDNQTVLDVYHQWLLLALDLGYLSPESLKRTAHRLWIDMIQVDVLDLNSAFAECLQLVRLKTAVGFKALCTRISPHLFSLLKRDVELMLVDDVNAAKRLIQLFSYTSRLSLNDIDLTQQLLEEYLRNEELIPQDYPKDITSALNRIIRRWMGSYLPKEIVPRHGPGGVAQHGRCSLQTKYNDLGTDQRLEYAFDNPWWIAQSTREELSRVSQTIFVPKSYKTFRTISMEPATLQYFQQGIWGVIDHLVARNGYLKAHIGFHDQTRNQQLAQRGSVSRDFATLDLSAASDSVGYELVKALFKGTWLPRYILATRSTKTQLPDKRVIELRKFAPMGSALCFPIETIIFASICELVTRDHHVSGKYSVFGDDIVVPTQCVEKIVSILTTLGFRVNHDKSFSQATCWFRESCGGEYCDGYDVTPMRVSRKYASREQLIRLAKLIEMANTAYKYGFRNLRYFFIAQLQKAHYKPLFAPTELLSDNYTNYHVAKRWNSHLQRIEVRVSTLKAIFKSKEISSQDESIRYRHWLESTHLRNSIGDGFQSTICQPMVVIQDAWRSKFYEDLDQVFIDTSLARTNPCPLKS